MSKDDSVKDEGKWTRDDLPTLPEAGDSWISPMIVGLLGEWFDHIVHHLNEHHPKPEPYGQGGVRGADSLLYRAERAERERDAAIARAEQAEAETEKIADEFADFRVEIVAEAAKAWEARQTAPTVTRDEVKNAIDRCFALAPKIDTGIITDSVMPLLSGDDPAVHVVRESDIAAVKVTRDSHGEWFADGEHVCVDDARQANHLANDYITKAVRRFAVARVIEAGQSVAVEEKARELYRAATPDARWETVADEYRRIARRVLGQEADQ